MEPVDDFDPYEWIVALRGGLPEACDFCNQPAEVLHPEEAGDWVCEGCLKRWGEM